MCARGRGASTRGGKCGSRKQLLVFGLVAGVLLWVGVQWRVLEGVRFGAGLGAALNRTGLGAAPIGAQAPVGAPAPSGVASLSGAAALGSASEIGGAPAPSVAAASHGAVAPDGAAAPSDSRGQPAPRHSSAGIGAVGRPGGGPAARCPGRSKRKSTWGAVVKEDLKLIRSQRRDAPECQRRGEALVFRLSAQAPKHLAGHAYEVDFPDYIAADEVGQDWRSVRSTLQLFAVDTGGAWRPLGPAHADHGDIARAGGGAFSHWRDAPAVGPGARTRIRFSTPDNVPLARLGSLVAVAYPMAPKMGWVEFLHTPNKKAKDYDPYKRRRRKEIYRELFFEAFPTVGVDPQMVDHPAETTRGTWYLWRMSHHDEFDVPLKPGEMYEKQMPRHFAKVFGDFERNGGKLFPPPWNYEYYENKVGLTRLFQRAGVRMPATWIFGGAAEARAKAGDVGFPAIVKDPYGYSSIGLMQAHDRVEFEAAIGKFFKSVKPGTEALVQSKVVAMREARVTYVDGRPFHGYWRIRENLKSASAASTRGGYQDFGFPLADIAPFVQNFANATGIAVGGVDLIWSAEKVDVKVEPYTLEVSPTSDINPATPADWTRSYAEFKKTKGFRAAYLKVRRQWTDAMVLAVLDRHRQRRKHLFVDIDNVVSLSALRIKRWRGDPRAYGAGETLQDRPVPDAVEAIRQLRGDFFIRFLTARGQYEDCFNVTQTWLDAQGFEYDDLIIVRRPLDKLAHLTKESLLVDDFTSGHEGDAPRMNNALIDKLQLRGLPFVVFKLGGLWADVLPQVRQKAHASAD